VRIPRCRATVSEEISSRSLGNPGKAGCISRTCLPSAARQRPNSRSQETGANRQHQPLSRVKGGVYAVLARLQ
jgi:hypothetical protein